MLFFADCKVDSTLPLPDDYLPSFTSLPGSSPGGGGEYHLVHISPDELGDNSPPTSPPTVMTRKRSSPTASNSSRESENSSTVTSGMYVIYFKISKFIIQGLMLFKFKWVGRGEGGTKGVAFFLFESVMVIGKL